MQESSPAAGVVVAVGEPSGGGESVDLECESQTCGETSGELYEYELAGDGDGESGDTDSDEEPDVGGQG